MKYGFLFNYFSKNNKNLSDKVVMNLNLFIICN